MRTTALLDRQPMPLVAEIPADRSVSSAVAWAAANRDAIQAAAGSAGVLLLRGFGIDSAESFDALCRAIEPDLRRYTGGDSPRTGVTDRVYTSTEYDASQDVLLHNELSYAGWSPRLVFFGCLVAAPDGGETPVADGREVYRRLPADIRERFESRGVAYLQHLWDADGEPGIGKSWQETFETTRRDEAEAYLERSGMTWEWTDYGIRTRAVKPAVVNHALTGEPCWWNQADQWHRGLASVKTSFGAGSDPRFDPATAGEAALGNHVTYGDGGEIDPADLETVRRITREAEVTFPWQAGDVMVIDNVLAMHGRRPFKGPRRILVAMA